MKNQFLLEIGTEEIPALFLKRAEEDLKALTEKEFTSNNLNFSGLNVFSTPRRITLVAYDLDPKQEDRTIETFGPPKRISFDEDGKPTKAALGFAKSQNIKIEEVEIAKRDNGEFLCVRNEIKGGKTKDLLKEITPRLITGITFAKSMKWGSGKTTFARPIRWITCIYNNKTVPFSIEDIKSSNKSYGHRFNSGKPFKVEEFQQYSKDLEKNGVILDPERRRKIIFNQAEKLASKVGGKLYTDEELSETVVNIVEYPVVLIGEFEKKYLDLPKEVLISVMKNHQKYFPVYKKDSNELLPYFIFVCGTIVKDKKVVIKGNERVLRARLNDGEFFWNEDIKNHLEHNLDQLESMVFLSEVGSYLNKTERLEKISSYISKLCGKEKLGSDVSRAAKLCKADLVSQMVFEFPELQGTMGKYYALKSGEKKTVATAIEEHYMPLGRDSELPETSLGSLLSIAEKIDNIVSCFVAGLKPTGSADPYALRRQSIGIIQIVLERKLNFSLSQLIQSAMQNLEMESKKSSENEIREFISERFRNYLVNEGFTNNVIDSVLATGFDNIHESFNKIKAVEKFTRQKGFDELAVAFKRVVNIAREKTDAPPDTKLFEDNSERELHNSLLNIQKVTEKYFAGNGITSESDYLKSLNQIKTLKEPVDNFFDNVMVMDKNEKLKNNRLALLGEIKDLFFKIADFSRI